MKLRNSIYLTIFLITAILWESCVPDPEAQYNEVKNHNNQVVHSWNELFLIIDKDAIGFRPGPGPKALGYIGLAAYETAVPGMPKYKSLKGRWGSELQIPDFDEGQTIHWPSALNACYATMFRSYFKNTKFVGGTGHLNNPEVHKLINELYVSHNILYKDSTSPDVLNNSIAWGEEVARAVFNWAKTDKLAFEAELNPFNDDPSKPELYYDWKSAFTNNGNPIPGTWFPTNDNNAERGGMFPRWGETRTFGISNSNQLKCARPIPFGDPLYKAQAEDVYKQCNATMPIKNRNIAEFWSDDIVGLTFSPPSRMLAILDQLLIIDNSNLEKAVESVAKLGLALNDFSVACWHSKYYYKVERPENYIQREIDPSWEPILKSPLNGVTGITPAFPAYPSGHSTFGGGGVRILESLFPNIKEFTDNCHKGRPEFYSDPITYTSLKAAGFDDAISRVYLGVHFEMDCLVGVSFGEQIAELVLHMPWKK